MWVWCRVFSVDLLIICCQSVQPCLTAVAGQNMSIKLNLTTETLLVITLLYWKCNQWLTYYRIGETQASF